MNFQDNGFEILKGVISKPEIHSIQAEVQSAIQAAVQKIGKEYSSHGIRNADKIFSTIKALSLSKSLLNLATEFLHSKVNLVRVIYFDKSPKHNWSVGWHQDKTICVNSKIEMDGWKAWSIKDGIQHVQPPVEVLNSMATIRIHLDDVNEYNGSLKVIPNSHKKGILSQSEIYAVVGNNAPFSCEASAGDALIMRPHIIHSSGKSTVQRNRRVVHMEFSTYELPGKLNWV